MKLSARQRKQLVAAILALCFIGFGMVSERLGWSSQPSATEQGQQATSTETYRVVKVQDGDTIVVDIAGKEESVRLLGVDTPEVKDPRKPVQCFGRAASDYTKQLIGNHAVRLETDPENSNRDRYDRLLRYVYLPDGTLVNAKIIEDGYGFAYTSYPTTKNDEFKQLENQARRENRGLWGSCQTGTDDNGSSTINPE